MIQYLIKYQILHLSSSSLGVLNVDTVIMDCYNAQPMYNQQKYLVFLFIEIFLLLTEKYLPTSFHQTFQLF